MRLYSEALNSMVGCPAGVDNEASSKTGAATPVREASRTVVTRAPKGGNPRPLHAREERAP